MIELLHHQNATKPVRMLTPITTTAIGVKMCNREVFAVTIITVSAVSDSQSIVPRWQWRRHSSRDLWMECRYCPSGPGRSTRDDVSTCLKRGAWRSVSKTVFRGERWYSIWLVVVVILLLWMHCHHLIAASAIDTSCKMPPGFWHQKQSRYTSQCHMAGQMWWQPGHHICLWPVNWPCPTLGLQLTGDHYMGKPGQPTKLTQPFILLGSIWRQLTSLETPSETPQTPQQDIHREFALHSHPWCYAPVSPEANHTETAQWSASVQQCPTN